MAWSYQCKFTFASLKPGHFRETNRRSQEAAATMARTFFDFRRAEHRPRIALLFWSLVAAIFHQSPITSHGQRREAA